MGVGMSNGIYIVDCVSDECVESDTSINSPMVRRGETMAYTRAMGGM